jgi:hypothetical protein
VVEDDDFCYSWGVCDFSHRAIAYPTVHQVLHKITRITRKERLEIRPQTIGSALPIINLETKSYSLTTFSNFKNLTRMEFCTRYVHSQGSRDHSITVLCKRSTKY